MSESKAQETSSERDAASSPESSDANDAETVEMMVIGRAKRATAGNRLSALLDKEAKDDIDLLFAEDDGGEEDMEFEEEDEDAEDAEFDSSSSSDAEDQDSTKGLDEDLTGERELQKQDRIERRKRKAQLAFKGSGTMRKRVKAELPTAAASDLTSTPEPRQKKKSERVSWVPTAADAPTRISSRKQTVKNREVVHKRLVDSERQRIKVMRQMEAAQKRKDALKIKPMTQAQRMEEAAKTERKNAKSLNRWEEAEKKRVEEQKAKLEALHNRQLAGPVISLWSGIARWINGKVFQNGVRQIRQAGHKEHSVLADTKGNGMLVHENNVEVAQDNAQEETPAKAAQTQPQSQPYAEASPHLSNSKKPSESAPSIAHPGDLLQGVHAFAALPIQKPQPEFTGTADGGIQATPSTALPKDHASLAVSPPSVPKGTGLIDEYTSRNLVALRNIDANASRGPELHDIVLLKKQKIKLQKPAPIFCAITSQPARFRDPKTGLPYAGTYAYKEIQRLHAGGSRWSNLLDCYVGSATVVARGVPERFITRS